MPVPENLTGGNPNPPQKRRIKMKQYIHKVSELLLKGYTPYQIGCKLRPNNKSCDWVYKCIKRIHQTLNQQIEANADAYLRMMEAKYGHIEVEMWEAWEASKKDHKGNPRQPNIVFMDRILVALEALRKLRGVDKQIEKKQDNNQKANVLDWDSLTKGRQLSSVTVNVNNNTVAQANAALQANATLQANAALQTTSEVSQTSITLPEPQPVPLSPSEQLKIELQKRMEELERRAIETQNRKESRADLFDDSIIPLTPVPQPAIYIEKKSVDAQKVPPPKQAVRRVIIKPIVRR